MRDILLTLVAWAALGWLLRDPIYVAYDYFLIHPIFELTHAKPLDIGAVWSRLWYFVVIAAGLITWWWLWGAIRIRRRMAPQPPALALEEQAAWAGLDAKIVSEARKFKVTNVRFNEDGSISGFEEVIPKPPATVIEPPQPAA
jgi:poly-beta-1,6-N-acetyl-D-glucosamine biosynthesis protein PgaD